jgi:hypothetical protein
MLERQAADGVDDLGGALPGRGDQAFAGDPDDLIGVWKSDSPCRGECLQRPVLDAAVAAAVVGGGDRYLCPGRAVMRASRPGWLDLTIIR